MKPRPNVLFIVTDQHCAEAMSYFMGSDWLKTPALDQLSSQSVRFTHASTASPVCVPARNALFTGRYPHQNGIECNRHHPRNPRNDGTVEVKRFAPDVRSMGRYFAEAGYDTAYFGRWHLNYDLDNHSHHGFAIAENIGNIGRDPEIADAAAKHIQTRGEQPFLTVVSFNDPHDICQYADGRPIPGGPLPNPPKLAELPPLPPNMAPSRAEGDIPEKLRKSYYQAHIEQDGQTPEGIQRCRELIWAYYRFIERVDQLIGQVLDALDASSHADNTMVVYTSDHGELLGAHGLVQKSLFYQEAVHVPLMFRVPGLPAATRSELVNNGIDTIPTLLAACGITIPTELPGCNLWPSITGQPPAPRDYVISQVHLCNPGMNEDTPHTYGRMVKSKHHHYWLFDQGKDREVLFDVDKDPGELQNLATDPNYREIRERHRAYLQEHAACTQDQQAANMLAHIE